MLRRGTLPDPSRRLPRPRTLQELLQDRLHECWPRMLESSAPKSNSRQRLRNAELCPWSAHHNRAVQLVGVDSPRPKPCSNHDCNGSSGLALTGFDDEVASWIQPF